MSYYQGVISFLSGGWIDKPWADHVFALTDKYKPLDRALDKVAGGTEAVARGLCKVFTGHCPIPDQCGIGTHDYCVHCQASTPRT